MSTAFYPTNMRRQSTGGYSNKSTLENTPYISWKGAGFYSNPVGITTTHVRPLTNKDIGNMFPTGFGLPRPLKQYRKGKIVHINTTGINAIDYNLNRVVKSSTGSSLGGGSGLISQLIDMPGAFNIKENQPSTISTNGENINQECKNCNGLGMVSNWAPIQNLSEHPEPNVTNPVFCCNQQRKALLRVMPANTNIKKNYYQTNYTYLYNRCQTFKQQQFNFVREPMDEKIEQLFTTYPFVTAKILKYSKPGDPLSIINLYVAQCDPNGMIKQPIESGVVAFLSKSLLNIGYITEQIHNEINQQNISVEQFTTVLKDKLTTDQYNIVSDYLYQLAANPKILNLVNPPPYKKGCSQVYYKPNNPQFAQQGAVSSSTRILKLNVDAGLSKRKDR